MPTRYASQEYANMHLIYGECRYNASAAAILYRERYPNFERYPDHRVFVNVHRSLTEGGHFPNQIRAGGRPSFSYEEKVLHEVADDLSISVRGTEERTGILKSTAHRILQRAEMHPFHVRVQSLLPRDYSDRISFLEQYYRGITKIPNLSKKTLGR
ncbi:hypothetical protein EVAR_15684_1 [Eumeta japonica]|uniref:DUF4817 domain-containing protein n=1 Tax=Eumeta variegata TaxID=151549 RepID=A0A4C1UA73_EUMVA|nr:hypothetical protein EVAR_15684_1 [Eumeta japonica]